MLSPKEAIKVDFGEILIADCLVAYIGNPPSSGVLMELGFAASIKKPIIIFTENDNLIPYFARGLEAWTDTHIINFDDFSDLCNKFDKVLISENI
jgi:nucleoside 2-deoxyribosyltransferase